MFVNHGVSDKMLLHAKERLQKNNWTYGNQLVHYSCVILVSIHISTEELFNLRSITLTQLPEGEKCKTVKISGFNQLVHALTGRQKCSCE